MRESQLQRLNRCLEFLCPIAEPAYKAAGEVHWLDARNADPDQGLNYCYECCRSEVDSLNSKTPKGEYLVAGGCGGYESDYLAYCESCDKRLDVNLTDEGVSQELEFWMESRICLRGKHASATAYDLLTVLECAPTDAPGSYPIPHWKADRVRVIQQNLNKLTARIDGIKKRALARQRGAQALGEAGHA